MFALFFFFFFQAEDGIRDLTVTGVQTCALPISQRAENCESVFRASTALRGSAADCGSPTAPTDPGAHGDRIEKKCAPMPSTDALRARSRPVSSARRFCKRRSESQQWLHHSRQWLHHGASRL